MFERIRSILIKEFLQVFRDPRMRTMIFVSPLVQVIVFGYAANMDVRNVPVAVYDLDNTRESRDLIRSFTYSRYFRARYAISTDREQAGLINRARASAVLRFDRGFGRDIRGNRSAPFQLILDATDSNTASIVLGYAGQIVDEYAGRVLAGREATYAGGAPARPSVDMRVRTWFNENLESTDYYLPGVIALIVTVMSLLLTAMAIVREKEIGTMEQLIVSPLRPIELILGKITPFAVIAVGEMFVLVIVAVAWFDIPMRGGVLLLLGATIIYLLTTLGIGLFISTISSTQQEAMLSSFFFFFPANLLSGFTYPIQNMPVVIRYVTYLNPLRYYLVILRGIFLKGVGIDILWPQILALFVMGLVVIVFSALKFRKTLG
ncbi:MAG: ABC transporter permease [bacterium]|nr:ABC transporter permease [bacterium]